MRRATTRWPALVARSMRVAPDLSSASLRVSETVRIAMLTGRKRRVSSIRGIGGTLSAWRIQSGIGGPVAGRKRVEIGGGLPEANAVDQIIRQHPLNVSVCLSVGDALDEEQRIFIESIPNRETHG